ncbi:helix-turn-helix transcriptional regulator [Bradyrhizobium sp. WSM 1738]|uniref:helix-turn-helix domain-containing protein n=1 Tax=Bradyrhizobium hereditatis TaxID=2821405 RepID=UPI001CE2CA82|nr:AraC family transcriptional regulator [Bradyrhizobium hereditatis]MCA6117209.1 helix-turn-helix transcriptional regulator [Bradyrhizobium hereditatis]
MGEIAPAKLIGWGARVLYLGPAFGLTPHRNATAVLAVGLDGSLEVADDPADTSTRYRSARSVLILPNTLHHLRIERGRMAFLYVDPFGRDLKALICRMTIVLPRAAFDLREEAAAIAVLTDLAENRIAAQEGRVSLGELLGIGRQAKSNGRIAPALRHMRDEPHRANRLTTLAARAGLSPSRFLHVFKAETGVPLRRYRIWNRMGAAMRACGEGASLTDAAHAAGFASSAHFSSAFRDMFGMMPSDLAKALRGVPIQA